MKYSITTRVNVLCVRSNSLNWTLVCGFNRYLPPTVSHPGFQMNLNKTTENHINDQQTKVYVEGVIF